jgi:dipeptidase
MCDTIVALPGSTAAGITLFGKNSDRQRNEAQAVEWIPRAEHRPGTDLQCAYITIPQARTTNAVLLCRPFWMWGAEMGANEHGVVIGNEAVFARVAAPQEPALTGMDLQRLALERGSTAAEAVGVIVGLLERYGQGGNCGHLFESYYHNSFMVADRAEAFVLETVGREWLVERVRTVRAISNVYSIEHGPERVSTGLEKLIRESGWTLAGESSYRERLADPQKQHIGSAASRHRCSTALLTMRCGKLDAADMMNVLRDHGSGDGYQPEWQPECVSRRTLCLHAGDDDRSGQTVGSMVSELRDGQSIHWVTATAAPCLSVFKPLLVGVPVPSHGPCPSDRFDAHALWWRHERFHRAAVSNEFEKIRNEIQPARDALESAFRVQIAAALGGSVADRERVVSECWRQAIELEDRWHSRIANLQALQSRTDAGGWSKMNRLAGIDFGGGNEDMLKSEVRETRRGAT